jgi:hypothetical protein
MNYVEMIDELRTVVYKNIRELSGTSSSSSSTMEYLQTPLPSSVRSQPYQSAENESSHSQQHISSGEEEEEIVDNQPNNKKLMKKIRGTTRKTIHHAEEGFIKLDHVIRQLRTNIQKK